MKKISTYVILFILTILFLSLDYIFFVKKAPKINFLFNEEVILCPDEYEYTKQDFYSIDSRGRNITDRVKVEVLENEIIYEVVDSFKNTTKVKRNIKRIDNTKPKITLNDEKVINIKNYEDYKELGATAYDNCDKNITKNIKITNDIVNNNKVIYEAIDSSNNKTTVVRDVKLKRKNNKKGVIYLTFDDGPSNLTTSSILDTLKKYNIKATFFVTSLGDDKLIKRAHNDGHTIGLHTYSHKYDYIYKSVNNYFSDLEQIRNRVYNITNEEPKAIRFPGGSSNTISRRYKKNIMSELVNLVHEKGYEYYDWNLSSDDAIFSSTEDDIYYAVKNNLTKDHDNVILMHDTNKKTKNVLERIIKYAMYENYEFRKIDENTKPVHHPVNN